MSKLTSVSIAIMGLLVGCGGQSGESSPAKQPTDSTSDTEVEFKEPAQEAEPPAAEAETAQPESDKPETPAAETNSKTAPAKKSCAGLPKKECEIMQDCAWSTNKKCVNQ